MGPHRPGPKGFIVALGLCLLAGGPATAQTTIHKHVSWNVDPLVGHPAGPYSLNFQLSDGAGTGNGNLVVTVSQAPFAGFTLDNTSFFQQANPSFTPTPGVPLEFDVSFTYTGADDPTPDQFSFAALDSSGFELPTLGPADALATFDLTPSGLVVGTFGSDPSRSPAAGGDVLTFDAPVITDIESNAVPEPGSLLLFLPALAVAGRLRRRQGEGRE